MDSALLMILSRVEATARSGRHIVRTQDDSGMTAAEWWTIVAPALELDTDDGDSVASASPDHALTSGLDTILEGIQANRDHH